MIVAALLALALSTKFQSEIRVTVQVKDDNVERRQQSAQVFRFRRVGVELADIGPASFGKSLGHDRTSSSSGPIKATDKGAGPMVSACFSLEIW